MLDIVLLTLLLATGYVRAQYTPTSGDNPSYGASADQLRTNSSNAVLLCNSTASSANASGIYPFIPGYPVTDASEPAWAITVATGSNNTMQTSLWYDTAGQNYSDDLSLDYDVCAFPIFNLPDNANRLGQSDSGTNCSGTISEPCRTALLTRSQDSALKWTTYSTPPPYSNLSAGVLPYICQQVENDIFDDGGEWPKECQEEFTSKDSPAGAFIDRASRLNSISFSGVSKLMGTSTQRIQRIDSRQPMPHDGR